MASKITRAIQKIFGGSGESTYFGVFGSRQYGTPQTSQDVPTIQSLPPYSNNGLQDAIDSTSKAPRMEDLNGLFYMLTSQLAYQFQEGVVEWEVGTPYFINSIVKKYGTGQIYISLTDTNIGNTLPSQVDNTYWHYIGDMSTCGFTPRGGIIMWAGLLSAIPAGWLLCDGTNGTPDLRDKFIYGCSAGQNPGISGGSSTNTTTIQTHTHSTPTHSHTLGNHGHTLPSGNTGSPSTGGSQGLSAGGFYGYTPNPHTHSISSGISGAPISGQNSTDSSGSGTTGGSGILSTDSFSILPPYYKLAFIQKS